MSVPQRLYNDSRNLSLKQSVRRRDSLVSTGLRRHVVVYVRGDILFTGVMLIYLINKIRDAVPQKTPWYL